MLLQIAIGSALRKSPYFEATVADGVAVLAATRQEHRSGAGR